MADHTIGDGKGPRGLVKAEAGRIFAGLGLLLAAVGAVMVMLAVMSADGPVVSVPRAQADIGSITISVSPSSGTETTVFTASGNWSPQGGQCWTPGGDGTFHYKIQVTDNGSVLGGVNPAACNSDFTSPVDSADRDSGGPWPASGQAAVTFTLAPGSHTICAVLIHVNDNGQDIGSTQVCFPQTIVVPTPTAVATNTATATATATNTATATATATNTATATATSTGTQPPTSTPTNTAVPTSTNTAVPTSTGTAVPTNTAAPTNTAVPTGTSVPPTSTVAATVFIPIEIPTVAPTATPTATLVAQVLPTVVVPTPVAEVQRLVTAGSGGASRAVNSGLLALGMIIILTGGGLLLLSRNQAARAR